MASNGDLSAAEDRTDESEAVGQLGGTLLYTVGGRIKQARRREARQVYNRHSVRTALPSIIHPRFSWPRSSFSKHEARTWLAALLHDLALVSAATLILAP